MPPRTPPRSLPSETILPVSSCGVSPLAPQDVFSPAGVAPGHELRECPYGDSLLLRHRDSTPAAPSRKARSSREGHRYRQGSISLKKQQVLQTIREDTNGFGMTMDRGRPQWQSRHAASAYAASTHVGMAPPTPDVGQRMRCHPEPGSPERRSGVRDLLSPCAPTMDVMAAAYFPISINWNVLGSGFGRGFGFFAVGGTGSFFSVPMEKT